MRSIAKIFGQSPFVPLQAHMDKVSECVRMVPEAIAAYRAGDAAAVEDLAKTIAKREHDADLVKHDIRNTLPRGLFMPIDRSNLLGILSTQDDLADCAENISVLLTFKIAQAFEPFATMFDAFVAKNMEAFEEVRLIIGELDELLETGFGGPEAQKVKEMVGRVAHREYEADLLQRDLVKQLLRHEEEMSYADFYLWTRLIRQVSGLSNLSENLADSVQLTLER
ncbi:MAG: TIGR00153 family protein [Phycisphaerales bacterium]|nr:TIGR00153 family protein [Phycisphaerae bacterium]NNF42237.1 TIGR00153 family protein [Phycisphaerales bacterium]NNM26946.1 TIGR00153 family protein [Phycisphaerales bacterium]